MGSQLHAKASVVKMTECVDTYCKCAYAYNVAYALTTTNVLTLTCVQRECHLSIFWCSIDARTQGGKKRDTSLQYITHEACCCDLGANV